MRRMHQAEPEYSNNEQNVRTQPGITVAFRSEGSAVWYIPRIGNRLTGSARSEGIIVVVDCAADAGRVLSWSAERWFLNQRCGTPKHKRNHAAGSRTLEDSATRTRRAAQEL